MTRSELIEQLSGRLSPSLRGDVDISVRILLDAMAYALVAGRRIEIRRFGSFYVKNVPAHQGRNPGTGEPVAVAATRRVHFRSALELQTTVSEAASAANATLPRHVFAVDPLEIS